MHSSNRSSSSLNLLLTQDHSTQDLRNRLIWRYRKYYYYWKDFTILVAFLAIIGLVIQLINWDKSFVENENGVRVRDFSRAQVNVLVELVTVLAVLSVVLKYYFMHVWMDYRKPVSFVKSLMVEQENRMRASQGWSEEGNIQMQDQETKETFDNFYKLLTDYKMWFEVVLLCLMPYSTKNYVVPYSFTMNTIDWIVPSGDPIPGTEFVTVTYTTSDVMLSLMVFRIYFVIQAAFVISPIERLNSRRICYQRNIEWSFLFQTRANLLNYPLQSMLILVTAAITFFTLLLEIYERPYWTIDAKEPYMQFTTF